MKLAAAIGAIVLGSAGNALARSDDIGSPLAIDRNLQIGMIVERTSGTLPNRFGDEFDRTAFLMHLRAGFGSKALTELGAQAGVELALRIGFAPSELEMVDRGDVFASGMLAFALRAYTFEEPVRGMVVASLGAEVATGGGHWWSDSARLAPIAGLRLAFGARSGLALEAEYAILPVIFTKSPGDLDVNRTEHRMRLGIGIGPFGIAGTFGIANERVRDGGAGVELEHNITVGGGLEWRD